MHEHHLMKQFMETLLGIARRENAKRVTGVTVRLGALSHFSKEHFREHFERASQGTMAEGADVTAILGTDAGDPAAQGVVIDDIDIEEKDGGSWNAAT